jgi:hypothetical protein
MLFVSVFAVLGVRLLYLEVIRNQYFLAMALDQRMRPIPLLASRGDILDRNQNKLAVSMSTDAIYATPVEIQDVEQVVAQLTPLLGLEPEWLRERLTRKQAMVWLKTETPITTVASSGTAVISALPVVTSTPAAWLADATPVRAKAITRATAYVVFLLSKSTPPFPILSYAIPHSHLQTHASKPVHCPGHGDAHDHPSQDFSTRMTQRLGDPKLLKQIRGSPLKKNAQSLGLLLHGTADNRCIINHNYCHDTRDTCLRRLPAVVPQNRHEQSPGES